MPKKLADKNKLAGKQKSAGKPRQRFIRLWRADKPAKKTGG
jgi:hypothetical protein